MAAGLGRTSPTGISPGAATSAKTELSKKFRHYRVRACVLSRLEKSRNSCFSSLIARNSLTHAPFQGPASSLIGHKTAWPVLLSQAVGAFMVGLADMALRAAAVGNGR